MLFGANINGFHCEWLEGLPLGWGNFATFLPDLCQTETGHSDLFPGHVLKADFSYVTQYYTNVVVPSKWTDYTGKTVFISTDSLGVPLFWETPIIMYPEVKKTKDRKERYQPQPPVLEDLGGREDLAHHRVEVGLCTPKCLSIGNLVGI